jgi:hypothetical protein
VAKPIAKAMAPIGRPWVEHFFMAISVQSDLGV